MVFNLMERTETSQASLHIQDYMNLMRCKNSMRPCWGKVQLCWQQDKITGVTFHLYLNDFWVMLMQGEQMSVCLWKGHKEISESFVILLWYSQGCCKLSRPLEPTKYLFARRSILLGEKGWKNLGGCCLWSITTGNRKAVESCYWRSHQESVTLCAKDVSSVRWVATVGEKASEVVWWGNKLRIVDTKDLAWRKFPSPSRLENL